VTATPASSLQRHAIDRALPQLPAQPVVAPRKDERVDRPIPRLLVHAQPEPFREKRTDHQLQLAWADMRLGGPIGRVRGLMR
jgi:hypothetical protein